MTPDVRNRFADPSGTGIAIVPRGTDDARLLPAPATENFGEDHRRPSLRARLAQLASAQLPKGRLAFDLDVRRSVTPRVSLVTTESVQVTGRLKSDSATLTTPDGLTDELQIGVAVPFECSSR